MTHWHNSQSRKITTNVNKRIFVVLSSCRYCESVPCARVRITERSPFRHTRQRKRVDLKLLISSAALHCLSLSHYFFHFPPEPRRTDSLPSVTVELSLPLWRLPWNIILQILNVNFHVRPLQFPTVSVETLPMFLLSLIFTNRSRIFRRQIKLWTPFPIFKIYS